MPKAEKVFKQNRMATDWGPVFRADALPCPVRVKRGVLDQLLTALRLAAGHPHLTDADANRAVAAVVQQHWPRLDGATRQGATIAQTEGALAAPLPLVLYLAHADGAVWVSDQPLLPYS
jgi:hypothetical protein